jgi:hypothetical protein
MRTVHLRNPYPPNQGACADYCCWNCYRILARVQETSAHLCHNCQAWAQIQDIHVVIDGTR